MSSPNPFITPFEGSSLAFAHHKVIEAFSFVPSNPSYTLKLIRVFYGATARKDIVEECEKAWNKIQRTRRIGSSIRGLTQHESHMFGVRRDEDLEEKVMQFYFQVTILLNEKGFTEFMRVKPRVESVPTI